MANIQLFARPSTYSGTSEYAGFVQLDLMETEPVKLSMSVQDFEEPTKVPSSYSKTFKVPHSTVNAQFFKAAFNVNSISYDISKKAESYILDNGFTIVRGNIRLTSIIVDNAMNNIQYEITFFGETSDFASNIGGGFLNELNLDDLIHEPTYTNITNSWSKVLLSGDVVYGLVEWGYTYDENNRPIQNTLSNGFSGTGQGSFTNPLYPIWYEQFKPQVRVKVLVDKIFEEAGFTYDLVDANDDPTFLESDLFKNLYLLSESKARVYSSIGPNFKAHLPDITYGYLSQTSLPVNPSIEEWDYSSSYTNNEDDCYYTAAFTGDYTFYIQYRAIIDHLDNYPDGTNIQIRTSIRHKDTGVAIWDNLDTEYETVGQFGQSFYKTLNPTITLTQGDVVKLGFHARPEVWNTEWAPAEARLEWLRIECTGSDTTQTTSINSYLPTNIKKIDFIKSICTKFKLVFVPSKDRPNNFSVIPWVDWLNNGTTHDWTTKLDGNSSIVIKPLFDKQSRKVTFKDKADSDYLNDNYQKSNSDVIFGQLILDSPIDLITGEKDITTIFAPSQLGEIGYTAGETGEAKEFLIPHIAKDSGASEGADAGKREPMTPSPRIVFYNGIQTSPLSWYMGTEPFGENSIMHDIYPLMSNFADWPVDGGTLDLNWNNIDTEWPVNSTGLIVPWQTNKTCYTEYWKKWYDLTYNPYSRIVEATFILSYKDILEFNFNDKVFVKDSWYFVNEIKDYVVGETSSCKVTLIKVGDQVLL